MLPLKNPQLRKPIGYRDSVISFRENVFVNTENQDHIVVNDGPLFSQKSMFSTLAFEYIKNHFFFSYTENLE